MTKTIKSDYYEREFILNQEDIEIIFELYNQWMKENKFEPEVTFEELNDENFDHVLYHAEIQDDKNGENELSSIIDIY